MTLPAIIDLSKAVVFVEDTDTLDSDYAKLMVEQGLLNVRIAEQAARYQEINDTLSRKNPLLVNDCNAIQGELSVLEETLQDLLGVGESDDELDELDAAIEEIETADKKEANRATRSRVKHLFNKIAAVCHPDKARNSNLVEIFYTAEAAKRNMDLTTLERLYEQVVKSKSKSKHSRDEAKAQLALLVEELRASVRDLKQTIQHNTTVGLNPVFERYELNVLEGELAFTEVMRRTLVRLQAHRANLIESISQARADKHDKDYVAKAVSYTHLKLPTKRIV